MKRNEIIERLSGLTNYFSKDGLLPTRIKWFAAGAFLGSIATYFLDPTVGSERRRMVKDKALDLKDKAVKLGSDAATASMDVFGRVRDDASRVADTAKNSLKSKTESAKTRMDSVVDRVGPDMGRH